MYRKLKDIKGCSYKLVEGLKNLAVMDKERVGNVLLTLYYKYYSNYEGNNKEENGELLKYFLDNYKKNKDKWNVVEMVDRTNNYWESLNRNLQDFIERQHIRGYKEDISLFEDLICQYIDYRKTMSKKEKSTKEKVEFKNDLIKFVNTHKEEMSNCEYIDMMGIVNSKKCYENMALSKTIWDFVKRLVKYCTTTKDPNCLTYGRESEEDDKYQPVREEEKNPRKKSRKRKN